MPDTENKKVFVGPSPFTDDQIGIGTGRMPDYRGDYANLADVSGPERLGGFTGDDGKRSAVHHEFVDTKPMISHPFSGPHPAPRLTGKR